jgi:hypothetical protein
LEAHEAINLVPYRLRLGLRRQAKRDAAFGAISQLSVSISPAQIL